MKSIIVVEAVSTGYNFVEDIIRRGYRPVILEAKGFDYVIIGYQKTLTELNEPQCLRLIFDTMELAKTGGKVIIPPVTYGYLSYGREGAETLLLIKGFTLEAPKGGALAGMVIGTNERIYFCCCSHCL